MRAEGQSVAQVGDQQSPAGKPGPPLTGAEGECEDRQEQDRESELVQGIVLITLAPYGARSLRG